MAFQPERPAQLADQVERPTDANQPIGRGQATGLGEGSGRVLNHRERLARTRQGHQRPGVGGARVGDPGGNDIPILMTALVTGVGFVPLALGAGEPGREIQQPMAVVILGGIVTSTFLNMIVIPALYLKYGHAAGSVAAGHFPRVTETAPAGN